MRSGQPAVARDVHCAQAGQELLDPGAELQEQVLLAVQEREVEVEFELGQVFQVDRDFSGQGFAELA